MSRSSDLKLEERYSFSSNRQLWHDERKFTKSLGCDSCHYRKTCGGLQIQAQAFDCTSFCRCLDPEKCDNLCPKNSRHLVARLQEIKTFELSNVPRSPTLRALDLPSFIPLIYHSSGRASVPDTNVVALSLYEMFNKRSGLLRFETREDLAVRFGVSKHASIVLSGTDTDPPLERWWQLPDRFNMAQRLAGLGIKLITAPNYSLFDDVPRLDNLYNMKRIAVCAAEIQSAGIQCAVHVNARTETDWERWAAFLRSHSEFGFIAFEFGTGAGAASRFQWHLEQLCRLPVNVKRPLHLVVRGGLPGLRDLGKAFDSVSFIDTASFVRAHRRRAAALRDGALQWEQALTQPGAPIDDLLNGNIFTMNDYVCSLIGPKSRALVQLKRASTSAYDVDEETLESASLAEMHSH